MSPETIDAMIAAGASAEVLGAAWKAEIAAQQRALDEKRAKDAERQRRHRESRDVTVTDCDPVDPSSLKVSPQTPLPKPSNQGSPYIPQIEGAWNRMAKASGLPTIAGIKGKRLRAVRSRTDDHGLQAVLDAIAKVPECPHWMGENGWLGNFDSLMRPENFQRMAEGTYASKSAERRETDPEVLRQNRLNLAGLYDRMGKHDEADDLRRQAAA